MLHIPTHAKAPADDQTVTIAFDRPGWRLGFENCPAALLDNAVATLASLAPRAEQARTEAPPDATMTWMGHGRCRWRAPQRRLPRSWARTLRTSGFRIVADIHDLAIDWFLDDHPDWLCLHAAAVETRAGLVCFPAAGEAGKSTVSAQLVAAGARYWTDDILPVDPDNGRALSLALPLALRLPYPPAIPAGTRRFLAQRAGPADRQWRYVHLEPPHIAPHGTRANLSAIVLLAREAGSRARLSRVDPSAAMSEMISGNLATMISSHRVLTGLAGVVGGLRCYTLTYSDLAEASGVLDAEFGLA